MSWLPNPYVLLALLIALVAQDVAVYRAGVKHSADACATDKLAAVQRAIAQADAVAQQDAQVMAAHEQARERIRTVFQPIRREVIRYVQTHAGAADPVCLDADGVRIWRAANAGGSGARTAGQPDYSLSTAAATGIRPRLSLVGQPRGDGAAVSRVRRPAEGAGGVGQ